MVLFQKWPFIELFFLRQYRPAKCFLCYSRTKKRLLSYKNKKFEKSKNWHFFKVVNPWFWSKNSHFSNFSFTRYSPEKCLSWYSRTKKSPSRQKKTSSNSQNIDIFPKGLTHGFGPKIAIFPTFFLPNIRQKNVYYDIPERKKALLGYKKNKFKKSKKMTFFRTG